MKKTPILVAVVIAVIALPASGTDMRIVDEYVHYGSTLVTQPAGSTRVDADGGRVTLSLGLQARPSGLGGWRYSPGYPHELSATAPAGLRVAPPGDNLLYGRVTLFDGVEFWIAVAEGLIDQKIVFFADTKQNGDFTDDDPPYHLGGGRSHSAATIQFPYPGRDEWFQLWSWTSLRPRDDETPSQDKPAFNYYSYTHRAGQLVVGSGRDSINLNISIMDPEFTGLFSREGVRVDWNGNRTMEDADVLTLGRRVHYRGYDFELLEIGDRGSSATFDIQPAARASRGVFDIAEDLAKEVITGNTPPELGVRDLDGNLVTWRSLRGKVVLLDFWASWCGPCVAALPKVRDTWERFRNEDFVILGISIDSTEDRARTFIDQNDMTWTHIWSPGVWQSELIDRFRVTGIPDMVLVDRNGVILSHTVSSSSLDQLVGEALASP